MIKKLVLGTRGSALALAQVELVRNALREAAPDVEIEVKKITTTGDKRLDISMAKETGEGLKGLFTREIEAMLLAGEIDVAVHSLKDLPGHLPAGLEVAAVLERANTSDLLISKSGRKFSDLPNGSVVATSSVRRKRQLLWARPDLTVEEIRGNVPTRLEKLRESDRWEAIILAQAGIDRLGLDLNGFHVEVLKTLPAIGQGAIGLEIRSNDSSTAEILATINHRPTFLRIRAERELLRLLNGDCHLPVGVGTKIEGDSLNVSAILFGDEGQPPFTGGIEGPADEPEKLANSLFSQIYGS
ncbi:MAG: hydroxymethylbilane synthase [Verrucomicrobiota bacterium]